MDLSLTCVVATQLWHHTFLGGGLCDLPTWSPASLRPKALANVNMSAPLEASLTTRA
jgi:asparagine synthase (glutamine-hydrolysing)